MPKSLKRSQPVLKFDALMEFLDQCFHQFSDHRASNTRYRLPEVLKAAFAMFSLKSASLLDFKKQTVPEESNLKSIYRIEAEIPCDNQMRITLDGFSASNLRPLFASFFKLLCEAGLLLSYRYWEQYLLVSIDGVEHFSSKNVHCSNCITRTSRNGEVTYHHAALAAVIVHPDQREVFALDFEPIIKQDGKRKNDCEREAAKRLCRGMHERHPKGKFLLVEDALYANAPHIRQISEYGWKYILNVKEASHKSLFKQFEYGRRMGDVKELSTTDTDGVEQNYAWVNGLSLCESAWDVEVNFLYYEERQPTGEVKRWTWITNLPLRAATVEKVMRAGRARWKIENETFNTLKNQGYNFTHNYGHGVKHLATVLALVMMLAFLVDQIQQRYCQTFQQLWKGLGSKSKLWAAIRNVFAVLKFESMEMLYCHIGYLYQIKLE